MSGSTARLLGQLKALSDPHRLRVFALCRHGEASVAEIKEVLGQSQPRVSQHLKHLCDAGLLRRFKDGRRVYYRLPSSASLPVRRLVELIPAEEQTFAADLQRLQAIRGVHIGFAADAPEPADVRRAFQRALIQQTVAAPLGDLLDVGCGRGDVLKLLAARANRAVGVDIDADARLTARAELLLAGLANCSLRKGDMYRLPFDDESFDTVVLDDVLTAAAEPVAALVEARRLLRPAGRLFLIVSAESGLAIREALAAWCAEAGLRVGAPRAIPERDPRWLLSIARHARKRVTDSVAA